MTIFRFWSYLLTILIPLLCGLTLLCAITGLSIFYIEQQFSYTATSFVVFAGVLFVVLVITVTRRSSTSKKTAEVKMFSQSRHIRRRLAGIGILLASIVFVVGSNYLANRSTIRWDVTQYKQHTLSDNTIGFIRSLNSEVHLTAFYVGNAPKYLQDLFKEYERLSDGIVTSEIIDPIEQIAYAAKFGNAINGKERKVIVQSGSNRKELDFSQLSLSEEKLNNVIARTIGARKNVYFLTGHGEYAIENEEYAGLSKFVQQLANNNIHSKPLMLGITQSIPKDCDVLIIAGPKNELTEQEQTLIDKYLTDGGDALFLIEHTVVTTADKPLSAQQLQQNPDLNALLNKWGLDVQSDIIVDLNNHVGDDAGSPATKNYQQHKAITEGLDYTFYIRPRSIKVLTERRPNIKMAAIASTSSKENSWAETNRELVIEFDAKVDTPGPVPFSYVVMEERSSESEALGKLSDTRIIVFTDADFLTNVYIDQYSNAQMGLNIVNWLAELDYSSSLKSQHIAVERLDLTSKQKRQVIVILVLIPFTFVVLGLIVWLSAGRIGVAKANHDADIKK